MKKMTLAPIALSLLAIALTGCGDGEDGIFGSIGGGSNSNNNEFTVSSFDRSANAIARIDRGYSTGDRDIDITNVVGSYNAPNIDGLDKATVLANNFEGVLKDEYIEVNRRTVKRPIYEKNSNNRFNYQTEYRTVNLAGVKASDYRFSNNSANSRGILTDLYNYNKIPNNVSFPSGSVCYVPVVSSDRSFFTFSTKSKTRYKTLDQWTDNAEQRFNDNRQSSTTKLNIGAGNNKKAVQVKFFSFNNEPEYLLNGVDYNDSIYDASFIDKDQARPNEDSIRGVIDCTLVNDVAADFLEREIRRCY